MQSRDLSGAKPTLVGQKTDDNFNGATVNLQKSVVPDITPVSVVYGVTEDSVIPYDDKNAVRETWTATGFPQITLHNYDAELNSPITTYVEVIPMGAAFTPGSGLVDWEERKIDSKHSLRVQNFIPGIPASFSTFTTQRTTFPAILSYISFQLAAKASPAGSSEVQYTVGIRAAFDAPTILQTNTEFYLTQPQPTSVFTWKPTDVLFKGASYSMNINNVLTDTWSGIGVTYAADAVYGNLVDRFNISSTVPAASTYTSLIGTFQIVSCVIERYKRLWVRKVTYLLIQ